VVDNFSPFTPSIIDILNSIEVENECKRVFDLYHWDCTQYDKIILSGRRKNNRDINVINSKIVKMCVNQNLPLLGICYGAEIIALTLGGSISRMNSIIQGQFPVSVVLANPLTGEKKILGVYESHSYRVACLPENFQKLASSSCCEYELFSHTSKKIFGTQFHPEKSGQDGVQIISEFVKI